MVVRGAVPGFRPEVSAMRALNAGDSRMPSSERAQPAALPLISPEAAAFAAMEEELRRRRVLDMSRKRYASVIPVIPPSGEVMVAQAPKPMSLHPNMRGGAVI